LSLDGIFATSADGCLFDDYLVLEEFAIFVSRRTCEVAFDILPDPVLGEAGQHINVASASRIYMRRSGYSE